MSNYRRGYQVKLDASGSRWVYICESWQPAKWVIDYAIAVATRENSRWALHKIESIQDFVFTYDYENIPLQDRARWETTGEEKFNQEVLRRLIEDHIIRDAVTVEQSVPEDMGEALGIDSYELAIVFGKQYSYTTRMGSTENFIPLQILKREGLNLENATEEEAVNTWMTAYEEGRLELEGSNESDRMIYLHQQLPIEKVLRDVVTSSDFTAYVDLVGDSLEFKDQLVKLSYIRNWFDFSFKQLVANPNQRPLQLYSYPELQQAVYYGNWIRELVAED
ncbi:hypothetical protein KAX21_06820 [candidate division WOR-3 bacterium]|nr:hypothetical protein [candidate division WOR-3 bacterium]